MGTLCGRLAGRPEQKGETAEGACSARGGASGPAQKMRRTVTYVERYLGQDRYRRIEHAVKVRRIRGRASRHFYIPALIKKRRK